MSSTPYAEAGTVAHALAAMCLQDGTDAAAYLGRLIECEDYEHAQLSPSSAKRWMTCVGSQALILAQATDFEPRSYAMEVTEDMAEVVQLYLDAVRTRLEQRRHEGAVTVELRVEQPLPIDHITSEAGATGTGDAVIVSVWADGTALLDVIDLKTGRGVIVDVVDNEQLQLYGCGALRELDLIYDITRVCLTIHQPRVKAEPSDWEIDIGVLRDFEQRARQAADAVHAAVACFEDWRDGPAQAPLLAGDHCAQTFCPVRATCPKLAAFVEEGVGAAFENLDDVEIALEHLVLTDADPLAIKMAAVDLIEDWCKAVRAEVERRLLAGVEVPGYKLVQGKRGARAWTDADAVEAVFKSMRLKIDEMYTATLITPTAAEKLLKDTPKRWARVTPLITQSEGRPHVAPVTDKRPALATVADDFEMLDGDGLSCDLAG